MSRQKNKGTGGENSRGIPRLGPDIEIRRHRPEAVDRKASEAKARLRISGAIMAAAVAAVAVAVAVARLRWPSRSSRGFLGLVRHGRRLPARQISDRDLPVRVPALKCSAASRATALRSR
jgi:hypothetical protein